MLFLTTWTGTKPVGLEATSEAKKVLKLTFSNVLAPAYYSRVAENIQFLNDIMFNSKNASSSFPNGSPALLIASNMTS